MKINETETETKLYKPMAKPKELPTLIKGKKLEKIDAPISTLAGCLAALAAGYWLESKNGFHFLQGDMFVYVDKVANKPTFFDNFYFQPFFAAYKLVDVSWWENIPDGGVFCHHTNGGYCFVNGVLDGVDKFAIIENHHSNHPIEEFAPVTDEWLESMKRGY